MMVQMLLVYTFGEDVVANVLVHVNKMITRYEGVEIII